MLRYRVVNLFLWILSYVSYFCPTSMHSLCSTTSRCSRKWLFIKLRFVWHFSNSPAGKPSMSKKSKMQFKHQECKVYTYIPVLNAHDEEVNKPGQRVLIHGINVGQVSDGEEQNGWMPCNWSISNTRRLNLFLSFLSNLIINKRMSFTLLLFLMEYKSIHKFGTEFGLCLSISYILVLSQLLLMLLFQVYVYVKVKLGLK